MKKYNVKITDLALGDMEEIYDYISEKLDSPATAMRQYNRIAEAIESLSIFRNDFRSWTLSRGFQRMFAR